MLPAEVSFPATLKRVAVVNNMPNVPDNKLIITEEEQKKSENEVARLTNYYNGDAAITTESLAEALANENYFEEVVICDSATLPSGVKTSIPAKAHYREMKYWNLHRIWT